MCTPSDLALKLEIKTEYITTDESYRSLANKYGISKDQIARWSKHDHWIEERNKYRDSVATECIQAAKQDVLDRRAKLFQSVDKLQQRVDQLLDLEDAMAPRDLKSLSSTMMDIKMMLGIRDEVEEDTKSSNEITVTFVNNEWETEDGDA